MKTRVLLAATLLVGLAVSAQAGVVNTKHDLSTNGGQTIKGTTNQVCVFCHAPHNATSNKLLWNRNSIGDGTNMKIYTSYNSASMRTAYVTAGRTALDSTSNSLLCLSCHSLTTAADVITNTAFSQGGTDASTATTTFPSKTGGMTNLTNDHPVGINYAAAVSADAAGFAAIGSMGNLRLFKTSQGADTMECASCHNVHDNANTKFLAINNEQSNLCVACHINK